MLSVLKTSVAEKQMPPEGQNNHVSIPCVQARWLAKHGRDPIGPMKGVFGLNLFKKQKEVKRAKDGFSKIWMGVRGKGQSEPFWKASIDLSVKTLKLPKIRSHSISADSMLKFCLSPVISYKHECSSGAPESLLFILLYPGCVQSIHNRPVFLINHKRFLFCLQLVLGWLTMASQSSYIKHRPFLTLAFCWGMQSGCFATKAMQIGHAWPQAEKKFADPSSTAPLVIFIWCVLRPNQIQRAQ